MKNKIKKIFSSKKVIIIGACLVLICSFFIAFGISYGIAHKHNNANNDRQLNIQKVNELNDHKNWSLDNSYSNAPAGKTTVSDNARKILDLSQSYDLKIIPFGSDIKNKSFSDFSSIDADPFTMGIVYAFDVLVGNQDNAIIKKVSVNNKWLLNDALNEVKISYFDLFSFNNTDKSIQNAMSERLSNAADKNKDKIIDNIAKFKIGDADDMKYLFSYSSNSSNLKFDLDSKTFTITSEDEADLFNSIVSLPKEESKIHEFKGDGITKYPFFKKENSSTYFFHDLLGMKEQPDAELDFKGDTFTASTKIKDVRESINSYLTSIFKAHSGLNNAITSNAVFKIGLYRSSVLANTESFSDDMTIADIPAYNKGKIPFACVEVDGFKEEYSFLEPIMNFVKPITERIWMNLQLGGNK